MHNCKISSYLLLKCINCYQKIKGNVITLCASEAAAQCIVIGPVCGFMCVLVGVCLFLGLILR